MVTTPARMRQLYATSTAWTSNDPTLLEGEVGLESDTRKFKVGPGLWSTLPYWGGLDDLGAPIDGILYGLKNGTWSPGVDWTETPVTNLDTIPPERAKFLRAGAGAANGWAGMSADDVILDLSHPDTLNRVQIGFSHSNDGEASAVIHTRVLRGTWSGWVTSSVFLEDVYIGDLNALASGPAPYSLEVYTSLSVSNGWVGLIDRAVVKTINQDADEALQLGWQIDSSGNATSRGLWLRRKQAGVWSAWERPSVDEASIVDLDRIRWRGNWVDGNTYLRNDAVLRYPYLRIANQETTDDPGITPLSSPIWDLPDAPVWTPGQFTGVAWSGHEYEVLVAVDIQSYAIWAPTLTADTNYNIRIYSYPKDNPDAITYSSVAEPVLTEDGWTVIAAGSRLYLPGTVIGVIIDALNSGPGQNVTGGWTRDANSNNAAPAAQEWITNNANTRVGVHFTDLDNGDRQSELEGIIAGSTITISQTDEPSKSMSWTVNGTPTTQANHVEFDSVTYDGPGATGVPDIGAVCTFSADIPVASPTDYVQMVDRWTTNPVTWANVTGILRLDGVDQTGVENDAFGVRIYGNQVTYSDEWDTMAISGEGGGTSGGGGGAATFAELSDTPASYAGAPTFAVRVKADGTGLYFDTFDDRYLVNSGDEMTGVLRFIRTGQDMFTLQNTTSTAAVTHAFRAMSDDVFGIFVGGDGGLSARFDLSGTASPTPQTVMTREKADARYGGVGYDSGWLTTWALPYTHAHTLGSAPMRYEFWLRAKAGNSGGWPAGAIMAGVPSMDGDGARHRGSYATATDVIRMGAFHMTNANNSLFGVTDTSADLRILLWADP